MKVLYGRKKHRVVGRRRQLRRFMPALPVPRAVVAVRWRLGYHRHGWDTGANLKDETRTDFEVATLAAGTDENIGLDGHPPQIAPYSDERRHGPTDRSQPWPWRVAMHDAKPCFGHHSTHLRPNALPEGAEPPHCARKHGDDRVAVAEHQGREHGRAPALQLVCAGRSKQEGPARLRGGDTEDLLAPQQVRTDSGDRVPGHSPEGARQTGNALAAHGCPAPTIAPDCDSSMPASGGDGVEVSSGVGTPALHDSHACTRHACNARGRCGRHDADVHHRGVHEASRNGDHDAAAISST